VDIFVLVINFLSDIYVPMHVIVGLFEVNKQSGIHGCTTLIFVGQICLLHRVIAL